MSFPPLPPPKSLLGVHRQLAPSAGVKVSPLCLGAMGFGTNWADTLGSVDRKSAFEILDYFYKLGGNFIDTSSVYQHGQSETWIGEWMKERGNRDEMVIATKYGTGWRAHEGTKIIQSNFGGMNKKSLKNSLEGSLMKLQTSFVDILYVHWWDYSTDIPELMRALDDVVRQGKVLYLGVSDTPAWIVAKANAYARQFGLSPFVVYQGLWSAATRDMERDIMPMCRSEDMAIAPWGALGGGAFKTQAQREALAKKSEGRQAGSVFGAFSPAQLKMSDVLESIANRDGVALTSVALAYVMQKAPYVFPIIGVRTLQHLKGNIEALSISLEKGVIKEIESALPFDTGFPHNLAGVPADVSGQPTFTDMFLYRNMGLFDAVELLQPIKNGLKRDEIEKAQLTD